MTPAEKVALTIDSLVRGHHIRARPTDCEFIDWLEKQRGRKDILALRDEIADHAHWHPRYLMECIQEAHNEWRDLYDLDDVQCDLVRRILGSGTWDQLRGPIEGLISGFGQVIQPGAMQLLVDYIAENHPNPKRLLLQPKYQERIHCSINLSELSCPDFPEIAGVEAQGALES